MSKNAYASMLTLNCMDIMPLLYYYNSNLSTKNKIDGKRIHFQLTKLQNLK